MVQFKSQNNNIQEHAGKSPLLVGMDAFSGKALDRDVDAEALNIFKNIYGMSNEDLSVITGQEISQDDSAQREVQWVETSIKVEDIYLPERMETLEEIPSYNFSADAYESDDYTVLYETSSALKGDAHQAHTLLLTAEIDEEHVEEEIEIQRDIDTKDILAFETVVENVDDLWLGDDLVIDYSHTLVSSSAHGLCPISQESMGLGGENYATEVLLDMAHLSL